MMFCARIVSVLLAAVVFGQVPCTAQRQPGNLVTVDASEAIPPPETGYLHLGGRSSNGHSLEVNSRYLVLDGKPWLPVMGELHYTRLPESDWEDEILKMKAAGINIISTYVFWIHHEEVEGKFDWSGRRDLRRFIELCAKHGMYVWLRPGPWAHGEVRNGGFPDWLVKLPDTRTNDAAYLHHVTTFFNQIGQQLHGLMFKDGGPVVGAQLENEYALHGPGRGAEHILKLKQIAIAAGIDPPLFSVTGWPSLDFPPQEVIPVSGGYPDGFWYGSQKNLPPSMNYLFNFNRELGDMGATAPSEDPTGKVSLSHDPYFAAEEAGGMASAYHRRPVLTADDIAALTLTGLGSGINLYGYYMFHGGTNPTGALTTLQESQATDYPNDLPERTYDFGAPLGEFGQERASYRKTRLLHLFLNAYGSELATMPAFAPPQHSRDAADTTKVRVAVRSDGNSGYVFVNNYVRQLDMPARPGFQMKVKLKTGELILPEKPIYVPANTYFAWPVNLSLGRSTLRYSTGQLLTRMSRDGDTTVVFYAIPGIEPEFLFSANHVRDIAAPGATIRRSSTLIKVNALVAGLSTTIRVTDDQGATTTILLLTKDQAEHTSLVRYHGVDHLLMTASSLLVDETTLRLRSTSSPTQELSVFPDLRLGGGGRTNGLWTEYTFTQPEKHLDLKVTQTAKAVPRVKMAMGPYVDWRNASVPTAPPDSAYAQAARWTLSHAKLDLSGLSQVLLQIDYAGDSARLKLGKTVVDDNFFNGVVWEVGLGHSESMAKGFGLQILPMPQNAPIYLDEDARAVLAAGPLLRRARLVAEYETTVEIRP